MRFSTIFTVLATASTALAARSHHHSRRDCLRRSHVDTLVANYQSLVGDIKSLTTEQIDSMIHSEFVDWSNSISAFFFGPYDQPAFPTKEAFVTGQLNAPRQMPIVVESIPVYTCDTVVIIWNAMFPTDKARGITIIEVDREDSLWKISRMDVEFNSLAWLVGVGGGYQMRGTNVGNITESAA